MAVSADAVVAEVQKFLGDQYVYGATGPSTFDCSGLMQYAYRQLGVSIPRTSEEQYSYTTRVPGPTWLSPGDLVFSEMQSDGPGHVGMYIGKDSSGTQWVVQAPHTGTVVQKTRLQDFGAQAYGRVPGLNYPGAPDINPGDPGNVGQPQGFGGQAGPSSWFQWPDQIVGFFTDLDKISGKLYNAFLLFFKPSTYVRIGAGLFGAVFLITGLVLLMREAQTQ